MLRRQFMYIYFSCEVYWWYPAFFAVEEKSLPFASKPTNAFNFSGKFEHSDKDECRIQYSSFKQELVLVLRIYVNKSMLLL